MSGFTKEIIIKTLFELLNEKPLAKITVKDIVERCGVNRNTFYYHFRDISDVVEYALLREVDKVFIQTIFFFPMPISFHIQIGNHNIISSATAFSGNQHIVEPKVPIPAAYAKCRKDQLLISFCSSYLFISESVTPRYPYSFNFSFNSLFNFSNKTSVF